MSETPTTPEILNREATPEEARELADRIKRDSGDGQNIPTVEELARDVMTMPSSQLLAWWFRVAMGGAPEDYVNAVAAEIDRRFPVPPVHVE